MTQYNMDYFSERQLQSFQLKKLQETIKYCYDNSKYYHRLLDSLSIKPKDITSLDDLRRIPPTLRDTVFKNPQDFIAIPKSEWVRIFSTAGSSGKPIYFPYTENDLERMSYVLEHSFQIAGVNEKDITQLTLPSDRLLWLTRTAIVGGHRKIGNCLLTFGSTSTSDHLYAIEKFKTTVVHGMATFFVKLGHHAKRRNIEPKIMIATGENIIDENLDKNALGKRVEHLFPSAKIHSFYMNSETVVGGIECNKNKGFHIPPEMGIVEVVDLYTGEPLPPGRPGALLITTFDVQGFPLIRYMVDDLTFLLPNTCSCGRTTQRLGPIIGKLGEYVHIGNRNIYPSAFANIIYSNTNAYDYYVRAYTRYNKEAVELYVTPAPGCSFEQGQRLASDIKRKIRKAFNIDVPVKILSKEQIKEHLVNKHNKLYSRFIDER